MIYSHLSDRVSSIVISPQVLEAKYSVCTNQALEGDLLSYSLSTVHCPQNDQIAHYINRHVVRESKLYLVWISFREPCALLSGGFS